MQNEFVVQTDKQEKITVEAVIYYCAWLTKCARVNQKAAFEVVGGFIGDGHEIEVTLQTARGKVLDKIKGKIYRNRFEGQFPISDTLRSDDQLFFKVIIPKLGLTAQSNTIRCKPAIYCTRIQWDRKEVRRGDIVKLMAQFEGILGDEEVTVFIYEYNQDGNHEKIATIPTSLQGRQFQLEWEFQYQGDVKNIPTEAEMRKYGKRYMPPSYFFVVVIDGVRIGRNAESGLLVMKDSFLMEVKIGTHQASKLEFDYETADGKIQSGVCDDNGMFFLESIAPGQIRIINLRRPLKHTSSNSNSVSNNSCINKFKPTFFRFATVTKSHETNCIIAYSSEKVIVSFSESAFLFDAHMHIQSNNCAPLTLQWAILSELVYKVLDNKYKKGKKKCDQGQNILSKTSQKINEAMDTISKIGDYIDKKIDNPYIKDGYRYLKKAGEYVDKKIDNISDKTEAFLNKVDYIYNNKIIDLLDNIPRLELGRRVLNNFVSSALGSAFVGRFGRIGRLSTYTISKVFMGMAKKYDFTDRSAWTLLSQEEYRRLITTKNELKKQQLREKAADKAKLDFLSEGMQKSFTEDFYRHTAYYYRNVNILCMHIALPMDMSYAHFWGKYRIPIYLNDSDAMYYIDDFIRIVVKKIFSNPDNYSKPSSFFVKARFGVLFPRSISDQSIQDKKSSNKNFESKTDRYHLYPKMIKGDVNFEKFSIKQQYERFVSYNNAKSCTSPFYIDFNGDEKIIKQLVEREYIHCIRKVPSETEETFEDYLIQLSRHEAAAVQFPMQIFPFYKYEPRRHYKHGTDPVDEKNLGNRAFFLCRNNFKRLIQIIDGSSCFGALQLEPHKEFNVLDNLKAKLKQKLLSNNFAFDKMFKCSAKGLFFGVKMYPLLGFAPDDFVTYPQLLEFYKTCEQNAVPITTHCSRGGMTIADYFNYLRYPDKSANVDLRVFGQNEPIGESEGGIIGGYDLHAALNFFSDNYAAPGNWENVLQMFNNLKLNLAHCGGEDLWEEFSPLRDNINDSLCRKWIIKIFELIEKHENVYTDFACFIFKGAKGKKLKSFADNLKFAIKNYPSLKDRILWGTDWYMFEKDKLVGTGPSNRKMFLVCQQISESFGWDAWHQFVVINPLRFLGLLNNPEQEKKKSEGPFEIDVEKLKKYCKLLPRVASNLTWKENTGFTGTKKEIEKNIDSLLRLIEKNKKIEDSKKVIRNGKLLILTSNSATGV